MAVSELAFHAVHRSDTDEAVRLGRQALEEAERLDDAVRIWAIALLASILVGQPHRGGAIGLRAIHSRGAAERAGGIRDGRPRRPRLARVARARLRVRACRLRRGAGAASRRRQVARAGGAGGTRPRVARPGPARRSPRRLCRAARAGARRDSDALGVRRRRPLGHRPRGRVNRRRPRRQAPRRRRPAQQRRGRRDECVLPRRRARTSLRTEARGDARRGRVGAGEDGRLGDDVRTGDCACAIAFRRGRISARGTSASGP